MMGWEEGELGWSEKYNVPKSLSCELIINKLDVIKMLKQAYGI